MNYFPVTVDLAVDRGKNFVPARFLIEIDDPREKFNPAPTRRENSVNNAYN